MNKKIIALLTITLLLNSATFAFKENAIADSSKAQKDLGVEHGHWYKGEVIKKLNYDSLWNNAIDLNNSPEGKQALNNCVSKYGGIEHLKTLKSFEIEYNSKSLLDENSQFKVNTFFEDALKYKRISKLNDSLKVTTVLNGNSASKSKNELTVPIGKNELKGELFSCLVMTLPANLNFETFSEIKFGSRANDSLDYLYLKKEDSLIMVLGIDPNDNYIKKVEGIVLEGGNSIVFINYFSNFKEYQGFIFPFSKMNVSMGLKMSEYTIESIKINQQLEENTFKID